MRDKYTHSVSRPQQWFIPGAQFVQQRIRKFLTPRPQLPYENRIIHTNIQTCTVCSLSNTSSFIITRTNKQNIQDYPVKQKYTLAYF